MKAVQVGIRFPADMKAWLEDQAKLNRSSQNSEVIRSVRERMKAAGEDLGGHAPAAGKAQQVNQQEAQHHAAE
ncbi:hypothetical protein MASR1M49_27600 [Pararhodobacter aggregans]